ncbi:hypothetical protein D3C78_1518940 [compost metagenome]
MKRNIISTNSSITIVEYPCELILSNELFIDLNKKNKIRPQINMMRNRFAVFLDLTLSSMNSVNIKNTTNDTTEYRTDMMITSTLVIILYRDL